MLEDRPKALQNSHAQQKASEFDISDYKHENPPDTLVFTSTWGQYWHSISELKVRIY